jgi:hypothetical protein
MTNNATSIDTTDLRAILDTGAAIVATARLLGELEGIAGEDESPEWNTGDIRGGLILALEQLGARSESLGNRALARAAAAS